ncbi:MAG TPA: apolipoprotein N-acyltransferase, partial [bacterium]|nr:apolipoprotein N-acyltransferase [bacterium]
MYMIEMSRCKRVILALISGLLVSASFPFYLAGFSAPDMGWIAWFALVPLFVAIRGLAPRKVFLLTFVAAFVWYGTSVFWVGNAMYVFGGLSLSISSLITLLLVLVVTLHISLAPAIAAFISQRWRGEPILLLPLVWVAMELFRNYFPCGGFPWSTMAMSQWKYLPLIQIADIVGAYGVIFLVVFINASIAEAIFFLCKKNVSHPLFKLSISILIIAGVLSYGYFRMGRIDSISESSEIYPIALIQGNISQDEKWDSGKAQKNLDAYRQEAAKLLHGQVQLIVWPEASFPWYLKGDSKELPPSNFGIPEGFIGKAPFTLFGAILSEENDIYRNSAVLVDSGGKVESVYHKVHMVPFGEYVPYEKLFFFLRRIALPTGNFIPGEDIHPMSAGGVRFTPLICYEDIFPELARSSTLQGGEFIANITNNAWFGRTAAPFQHLALSIFRAVENRRYMLRSTNTGVSAVVDPVGRVLVRSELFEPATIVSSLK